MLIASSRNARVPFFYDNICRQLPFSDAVQVDCIGAPYVVLVYKDHEDSRHEVVASWVGVEVSMDQVTEVVAVDACRDEALAAEDTGTDAAPMDPKDWLNEKIIMMAFNVPDTDSHQEVDQPIVAVAGTDPEPDGDRDMHSSVRPEVDMGYAGPVGSLSPCVILFKRKYSSLFLLQMCSTLEKEHSPAVSKRADIQCVRCRANERLLDDGETEAMVFDVLRGAAAVQICESIALVGWLWWLRLSERKLAAVEDHEVKSCSCGRSVEQSGNGIKGQECG